MEGIMDTSNIKKYVYDIKFEVVMKDGTKTIPGKSSLVKALLTIKNSKRKTEKIDFFDTNGIQISPDIRGIEQDEIEGRCCMEVGGSNGNHLFFACTIQTNIPFSVLKGRTIDDFKKNNIYFKIHKGGFKYGVNWSPIGFFLKQHPGFIDNQTLRDNLMMKIVNSWNNETDYFDDDQKNKISRIIDPETHLGNFDPTLIPFEIIQTTILAKNQANETCKTNAVVLTIPFQFFKVGITIMDYMAITTDNVKNYIPIGYKKEDPENFFNILYDHSAWMQDIRLVTITNVSTSQQFNNETNREGQTLHAILNQIPEIETASYIEKRKQVFVTIPAKKVQHITDRIIKELAAADFPYKPQVAKKFNPTGSLGSNKTGTSKYSAAMSKYQQTTRSPNVSIATSYGEEASRMTGYTGRSWGTQRKIPREIDFTDATEFPPLYNASTTNKDTTQVNIPQSMINDESITDTTVIQQAIDSALKKAYEDHRRELAAMQARFDTQLEELKQQQNTTSLEMKFDKLLEMLTIDSNVTMRESPIRKKGKPNNLEATTYSQTETPTRSNKTSPDTLPTDMDTDDNEPLMGPLYDALPDSPQRIKAHIQRYEDGQPDNSTPTTTAKEEVWITKEKKDKRATRSMTQTLISDTMSQGGYGQTHSPPRRNPSSPSRTSPKSPGTRNSTTTRTSRKGYRTTHRPHNSFQLP